MPLPSRSTRAIAPVAARTAPVVASAVASVVASVVVATLLAAAPAAAQAPGALTFGPIEPELRLDALVAEHRQRYELGVGAFRAVGRAVRLGVVAAGGVADRDGDDETRASGRAELVARFTLQTTDAGRPRLYLGAGAGGSWVATESGRAVAHLLVGGEVSGGGWRHAVELALGDGVRAGVVLRRAR